MIDNRTASAIDLALQKHHTPVGDLYAAICHGRMKRCFSRDTAIRYLAYFMTSHAFERSGFHQRYPDVQVVSATNPVSSRLVRGGVTQEYFNAHRRTVRRLRRILARKREYRKWKEKHDALVDRYHEHLKLDPTKRVKKKRDELQSSKPF